MLCNKYQRIRPSAWRLLLRMFHLTISYIFDEMELKCWSSEDGELFVFGYQKIDTATSVNCITIRKINECVNMNGALCRKNENRISFSEIGWKTHSVQKQELKRMRMKMKKKRKLPGNSLNFETNSLEILDTNAIACHHESGKNCT